MRLLALLLLAPSLAFGQGLNQSGPGLSKPRTNWALQSNSVSTTTAFTSPWGSSNATVATVAGAPTSGTWAEITSTNNTGRAYQIFTVPSSTTQVISLYVAKSSGTGPVSFDNYKASSTVTACTCTRSDGGTCTAAIVDANASCRASIADLGTTAVRVTQVTTRNAAQTAPILLFYPGEVNVSTATTRLSGVQIEAGVAKASKLCVTTTAAKTCK